MIIRDLDIRDDKLTELKRSRIQDIARTDTALRYDRRSLYHVKKVWTNDPDLLQLEGTLKLYFEIGSYVDVVELTNFTASLRSVLETKIYSLSTIEEAIVKSLDTADLNVYCSCPDFKYRFSYINTNYGMVAYLPGQDELRPPKKTNPKEKGVVCKHLINIIVRPSQWIPDAVKIAATLIKRTPAIIGDKYRKII